METSVQEKGRGDSEGTIVGRKKRGRRAEGTERGRKNCKRAHGHFPPNCKCIHALFLAAHASALRQGDEQHKIERHAKCYTKHNIFSHLSIYNTF